MTTINATAAFGATVSDLKSMVASLETRFYGVDMPGALEDAFNHACIVIDSADEYAEQGIEEADEFGFEIARELRWAMQDAGL